MLTVRKLVVGILGLLFCSNVSTTEAHPYLGLFCEKHAFKGGVAAVQIALATLLYDYFVLYPKWYKRFYNELERDDNPQGVKNYLFTYIKNEWTLGCKVLQCCGLSFTVLATIMFLCIPRKCTECKLKIANTDVDISQSNSLDTSIADIPHNIAPALANESSAIAKIITDTPKHLRANSPTVIIPDIEESPSEEATPLIDKVDAPSATEYFQHTTAPQKPLSPCIKPHRRRSTWQESRPTTLPPHKKTCPKLHINPELAHKIADTVHNKLLQTHQALHEGKEALHENCVEIKQHMKAFANSACAGAKDLEKHIKNIKLPSATSAEKKIDKIARKINKLFTELNIPKTIGDDRVNQIIAELRNELSGWQEFNARNV